MRFQLEGKKPAEEYVIMEMLSREYGWTPEQIREQRASDIDTYVAIIMERSKIERRNSMQRNG